jgi:hemolysin III
VHNQNRVRLGKMTNPVRGFLHGTAAILSVVGGFFLWFLAPDGSRRIALLIYALSLVALYTVSSLYHSIPWREHWRQRMQRLDHSMIYLLVAGTNTPIAWIVLDGWAKWVTIGGQWGIVLVGVTQKILFPKVHGAFSVALQTTQGWLALVILYPLAQRLPWTALFLVALGGVFYTVGMVMLVTGRPRLWPRVFSHHEMFHVFVVAGSSVHFAAITGYVVRFGV